jgi:transposase
VSIQTIANRLHELNYDYKQAINKPLLTQEHKEKRLEWANKKINYDWDNVVFSDETSIWLNFNDKRWISKDKDKTDYHRTIKYPIKLHVWGYISKQFGSDIFIFTGILNAKRYLNILIDYLVDINEDGMVFQDDNDPKHRAKIITQWKDTNNIISLDWPANSPDLNPIENIWAVLKRKLRRHKITNLDDFEIAIKACWRDISQKVIDNTISSMGNRVKDLIDTKGDSINY